MAAAFPTEQLFLSYSRNDLEAAVALRTALEQTGFSVFRDEDSIRTGDNWMQCLQDALQGCAAFVVLIGRDGVQRWVGAEVQVALIRNLSPHDNSQRLPIFPLMLPEGDRQQVPPFLSLFQIQPWQADVSVPQALIEAIRCKAELLNPGNTLEGNPFLGLSAFQPEHAHLFFGRRRETLEALQCLGTQREVNPDSIPTDGRYCCWLQIEGNSGSGKSSLVNAGMLPLIQQGALWARTGYETWRILDSVMPGETPLRRLAEVLEHAFEPQANKRDSLARQQRLEADDRALAYMLNDHKDGETAFLLVVDQFEELFTFSDPVERRCFDAQLAHALQDKACPLFLISTVRIDFLEGFETLPRLSELYNHHCRRYLLKTISPGGLREAIEQPARLAGLNVGEITTAMLGEAENEVGVLPLVENALDYLWAQRDGNRLSGALYREKGGIAGLLEEQADVLLARLEKRRADALELLLALTRINDEGRHTRRRLPLAEARLVAGGRKSDPLHGQRIIDVLSGRAAPDGGNRKANGSLRLITVGGMVKEGSSAEGTTTGHSGPEYEQQYVDLIHETLIRARSGSKDAATGKPVGYWKTLYDFIEQNRDRGFYRDQLSRQAQVWQAAQGISRWWRLAGWRDLKHYRNLRPARGSVDERFKHWSRSVAWLQAGVLTVVVAVVGESYLWTLRHGMPPGYMVMQQKFRLMHLGWLSEPLPEMVHIPPSQGEFRMGELDDGFVEIVKNQPRFIENFGIPSTTATLDQMFALGKYEVNYEQYDYYVWQQQGEAAAPHYPDSAPGDGGRGQRAVVNVSWNDANGYLRWLTEKTGDRYRLPTEAEWEYAARAGTATPYWWGDEARQRNANCQDCGSEWDNQRVASVGQFASNAWGLYDTAGNVWEWTCSAWVERFDGSEQRCVEPGDTSVPRVLRGGSWNFPTDWLRSSARFWPIPAYRNSFVGFRVFRATKTD